MYDGRASVHSSHTIVLSDAYTGIEGFQRSFLTIERKDGTLSTLNDFVSGKSVQATYLGGVHRTSRSKFGPTDHVRRRWNLLRGVPRDDVGFFGAGAAGLEGLLRL